MTEEEIAENTRRSLSRNHSDKVLVHALAEALLATSSKERGWERQVDAALRLYWDAYPVEIF